MSGMCPVVQFSKRLVYTFARKMAVNSKTHMVLSHDYNNVTTIIRRVQLIRPMLTSYPHPVKNHNPHQNCLKLYFAALQETCQIQKRQSNCKIAFNISKLVFKSILSISQRKNCKNTEKLPRLPQWIRTYPLGKPIFSQPAAGCERR